jgi:hypothetical protein
MQGITVTALSEPFVETGLGKLRGEDNIEMDIGGI